MANYNTLMKLEDGEINAKLQNIAQVEGKPLAKVIEDFGNSYIVYLKSKRDPNYINKMLVKLNSINSYTKLVESTDDIGFKIILSLGKKEDVKATEDDIKRLQKVVLKFRESDDAVLHQLKVMNNWDFGQVWFSKSLKEEDLMILIQIANNRKHITLKTLGKNSNVVKEETKSCKSFKEIVETVNLIGNKYSDASILALATFLKTNLYKK